MHLQAGGACSYVPEALAKRRPGAAIEPAGNWGGFTEEFCCVRLLNPLDPLFTAIGSAFVKARRCWPCSRAHAGRDPAVLAMCAGAELGCMHCSCFLSRVQSASAPC